MDEAQLPAHLEPIGSGEHEVEQDDVGSVVRRRDQPGWTVAHDIDVHPGALEIGGHDSGDRRVVVDHEHPGHDLRIGLDPPPRPSSNDPSQCTSGPRKDRVTT
jgi:hypothetical protein